MNKEKNQPTRNMEDIWEIWHDPDEREKKKLKKRKEERKKEKLKDLGL